MDFRIVPYREDLRKEIEAICCETGFLGKPIEGVFKDTQLFSKYLTGYYLSVESDLTFVALDPKGRVVGYIAGSVRRWRYRLYRATRMPGFIAQALGKILLGRYDRASLKFCVWLCFRGWREIPKAPLNGAHFHFNVTKAYRNTGAAKRLLETFLKAVESKGGDIVYGQMLTFDARRCAKLYRRLGWEVLDKKAVSKYSSFLKKRIYLTTIYRSIRSQGTRIRLLVKNPDPSLACLTKEGKIHS